jgi:predicted dehydrogenase
MPIRIAFAGFRHLHILAVYKSAASNPDIEVVAACEPDAEARATLPADIKITHTSYKDMLDNVECDAVAVGDYFAARGKIIIDALKRGKHVVADKPICTDLAELDTIEKLAAEKKLAVVAQFDMINGRGIRALRDVILSGRLGKIHQIHIGAQHPLMYGKRVPWYFEEGKQGGTLNDIGVHAVHALPWMTGSKVANVFAAREWNAFADKVPHFRDSAQAMLTLDNGCGVVMDVSYATPTSYGYKPPHYWRFSVFGSKGVAETNYASDELRLWLEGKDEAEIIKCPDVNAPTYLEAFIAQATGKQAEYPLRTSDVLHASRQSLLLQQAADNVQFNVKV